MISFSSCSVPLQQRWRNNGLSADFIANYLATFFPADEDDANSIQRQVNLKSTVSYIVNELLENAMKFHENTSVPIQFELYLLQNVVVLLTINCTSMTGVNRLRLVIKKLINSDHKDLYIQHLESLVENENNLTSGLGFLTILHDYLAKIGWKIESFASNLDLVQVTTMVQFTI